MGKKLAISVKQCAARLSISDRHCYELIRRGDIPAMRLGGQWVVPVERLEEMLRGSGQHER